MNTNDLAAIRTSAELQNLKPYMDNEVEAMQRAVVSFVLSAVNNGTLTPDIAHTKWVEYISYTKLQQKLEQRIRIGQGVGAQIGGNLDFSTKPSYTELPINRS